MEFYDVANINRVSDKGRTLHGIGESGKQAYTRLALVFNNPMTYDESMARLEAIIKELESAEAISMDAYKQKALEAKELLAFCRNQLTTLEDDLNHIFQNE